MDRSRGRARGRSRPQLEAGSRPGMPQGSSWQPLPRGPGAWGGPQGGMPPQPSGQPQMQAGQSQRQPAPQGVWGQQRVKQEERPTTSHGRASSRGGDGPHESGVGKPISTSGSIAGGGDYIGRGASRGGRVLPEKILQTRPEHLSTKKGSTGRPVKLCANFFQLLQKPSWCLYQYRVDFAPEEDQTAIRKRLMRTAVKELDLSGYIFDGTVMCAPRRLTPDPLELFVDGAVEGSPKVRITIKLVGDVAAGDYHYLQVYNLIIRKCMSYLKLQLVGRNFFDPLAKIRIPQFNMEIWPGYVTSIRQHEDAVLLSCEITHKIMRNERVYDLMLECSKDDHVGWKKIFQSKITGTIVLTDYNNKTYRIDDIDFDSSPASTFTKKDGTSISYVQYYQQRYGINIVNMQQPLLISVSKPREIRAGMSETIVLIPELCRMTGLTDQQKANFALMKALADHTRVGPEQRIQKLYQFSQRLKNNQEVMAELRQWDWELANNVVEFAGRVLPNEKMIGGGTNNEYPAGRDVDWTKELRTRQMFTDVPINYWVIVFASRLGSSVHKFAQMLKRAAQGMHCKLGEPRPYEISDDRISNYLEALNKICSNPKSSPQLILCIVSNNKSDRYAAIKKKCCVDTPMPTQVMVARNLDSKGAMSIATKIAIQINCKIGGAPWTVNIPLKGLMIIGYDVCHDPQDKRKSYGATVASLDKHCTRYFSTSSAHTSGEELSNDFALNIIKAVKVYQQVNNSLPERFLIYRDGVGDGQLPYVHEHEVEQIKKKLAEFYGQPIRMAFIIVSKRINTRIFAINRNSNPEPGTVVDDVITLPERYDFYLVSQCTRQGTVSPTSYNIISDNFGLDADKLQLITHKLTHMYYNWSGTVRVPAPCQYAHKLAFLTSQSLKRSAHPGLSNLLYYL